MYDLIVELYCILADISKELTRAIERGKNRIYDSNNLLCLSYNHCNMWNPIDKKHLRLLLSDATNVNVQIKTALELADKAFCGCYEDRHLIALQKAMDAFKQMVADTNAQEEASNRKREESRLEAFRNGYGY